MIDGQLFLVGATHRTAPLGLREKLALSAVNEAALAADLKALTGLAEFVILNTCNRVEIYGVGEKERQAAQVAAAFCTRQGFAPEEFERIKLGLTGRATVEHLLEVASGLDSQMIGENEIFGQVKKAFLTAQGRGSAGPVLNRIFQKAFQAAKRALQGKLIDGRYHAPINCELTAAALRTAVAAAMAAPAVEAP